jgi:hypothetical protein
VLTHKPRQTSEAPDALAGEANVRWLKKIMRTFTTLLILFLLTCAAQAATRFPFKEGPVPQSVLDIATSYTQEILGPELYSSSVLLSSYGTYASGSWVSFDFHPPGAKEECVNFKVIVLSDGIVKSRPSVLWNSIPYCYECPAWCLVKVHADDAVLTAASEGVWGELGPMTVDLVVFENQLAWLVAEVLSEPDEYAENSTILERQVYLSANTGEVLAIIAVSGHS